MSSAAADPMLAHSVPTPDASVDNEVAWLEACLRRALEIGVSLAALTLVSPLLLVIAVIIRLDSPGPILFRQWRVGRNRRRTETPSANGRRNEDLFGRPFELYKFRTMYADAPDRYPDLYQYRYTPDELREMPIKVLVGTKERKAQTRLQSTASLPCDPRITRIGAWLRRTSLDEFPNFINVLKGDMHLVGPRPDIVANIRYYTEQEMALLRVKPGITGLAQINGRGLLSFRETNAYDLEYIKKRSLSLDLRILFKTIPALVKRDGAF